MSRTPTAAALALCLWLAGCGPGDASSPAPAELPAASAPRAAAPTGPPAVRVDTLTGASQSPAGAGAYRFRVQVPQLVSGAVHDQALDMAIMGALQREVAAFVDAAQGAAAAPVPGDLTCASSTVRLTVRLAVFRVDCTEYQAGSAHPNAVIHTFNCDLAAGRVLALQDLFRRGSGYLDLLSAEAQRQLEAKLGPVDQQTLSHGTAAAVDNFSTFLLDRGGLTIVFAMYQVAPGTAGEPEVTVSYEALARFLAPGVTELVGD